MSGDVAHEADAEPELTEEELDRLFAFIDKCKKGHAWPEILLPRSKKQEAPK
jgi:hypothetical protein